METNEAIEIIEAVAEADYGSVEPADCKRADVRAWLTRAMRPGYSSIDNVAGAVDALGMERAIDVYTAQIAICHETEYSDGDE